MNTGRKTAITVGILYIIGTVAGVLSVLVTQPILSAPDYLAEISANENPVVIFVQELVMAVWLIVQAFNPSAIASGAAAVDVR